MSCWRSSLTAVLILGGVACTGHPARDASLGPDAPVRLTIAPGRVTVAPLGDVRLNALLPPALEYADGAVARLDEGARVEEGAYFAGAAAGAPPATRAAPVRLRVSYCRRGESLCRSQQFPLSTRSRP